MNPYVFIGGLYKCTRPQFSYPRENSNVRHRQNWVMSIFWWGLLGKRKGTVLPGAEISISLMVIRQILPTPRPLVVDGVVSRSSEDGQKGIRFKYQNIV